MFHIKTDLSARRTTNTTTITITFTTTIVEREADDEYEALTSTRRARFRIIVRQYLRLRELIDLIELLLGDLQQVQMSLNRGTDTHRNNNNNEVENA